MAGAIQGCRSQTIRLRDRTLPNLRPVRSVAREGLSPGRDNGVAVLGGSLVDPPFLCRSPACAAVDAPMHASGSGALRNWIRRTDDRPQELRASTSLNDEWRLWVPRWPRANCGDEAEPIQHGQSETVPHRGGCSPRCCRSDLASRDTETQGLNPVRWVSFQAIGRAEPRDRCGP